MGQEGIVIQYGAQKSYQAVTSNLTLDRYDTGKLLVLSGGAGRTDALTCSLPAIADVDAGWQIQIMAASNHNHAVACVAGEPLLSGAIMVTGAMGSAGQVALPGSTSLTLSTVGLGSDVRGTQLEIFSDGTNYFISGLSTGGTAAAE